MQKTRKNKQITISFVLLMLGTILSLRFLFYNDFSFTVLSENVKLQNAPAEKELLKGKKIVSSFKARENNLGIVAVRFTTFKRGNDDNLIFRLKEKDTSGWMYESEIRTTFEDNKLYNFGVPIIADSKEKEYLFEIKSEKGSRGNAVGISAVHPQIVLKYKFPKSFFLSSPAEVFPFFLKKSAYILSDVTNTYTMALFFLPLMWFLFLKKILKSKEKVIVFFTFITILDVLSTKGIWEDAVIVTTLLLIFTLYKLKKVEGAVWIALFSILQAFFFYSALMPEKAEKAIIWAFFILFATVFYTIFEKKSDTIEK